MTLKVDVQDLNSRTAISLPIEKNNDLKICRRIWGGPIHTMQGRWRGTRSLRNVNLQPFCNADGRTAWSEAKHCAVLGPNQSQYCSQNKHLRAWRTCENKAHPLLTAAIWSASTLKISGLEAKPPRRKLDSRAVLFVC